MKIVIRVTDVDIKRMFRNYYDRKPHVFEIREIIRNIKYLINEDSLETIIHNAGTF